MIFLAVSGLMFVIAAAFIQGKVSSTQFHQSINDINTKINQVIGDVSNGFYPSNNDFSCSSSSGNANLSITSVNHNQQGTNGPQSNSGGCTFIGKTIQMAPASDNTTYNVYTLAASQFESGASTGNPPVSYNQAELTAISPSPGINHNVDVTEFDTLEYGLTFSGMWACHATCDNTNGTAITGLSFLASNVDVTQANNYGPQTVNVVPIFGAPQSDDEQHFATWLDGYGNQAPHNYDADSNSFAEVIICFNGPGANQYGAISLYPNSSSGGQRLATTLQVNNAAISGCH